MVLMQYSLLVLRDLNVSVAGICCIFHTFASSATIFIFFQEVCDDDPAANVCTTTRSNLLGDCGIVNLLF